MTGASWMSLRIVSADSGFANKPVVHIGISKRVAPQAVRRNRLKRLIREGLRRKIRLEPGNLYRIRVDRYPANPGYALVERELVQIFN